MSAGDIPALLKQLHNELNRATSLDLESKELLSILAQDFAKFESQMSIARQLAVRFEAEHPRIAAVLRQVTDAFSKAGM